MNNKTKRRLLKSRTNKVAYLAPVLVAGLEALKEMFPELREYIGTGFYVAGSVALSAAVVYFRTFTKEDDEAQ